jgi:hypothetical protein
MRRLAGRLLLRVADALDRNLVTVPDLDDDWPWSSGQTSPAKATACVKAARSTADARP